MTGRSEGRPREGARRALRLAVREEPDVVMARQAVRAVAREAGLAASAVEAIATAVSEIARNIVVHSRGGEIAVRRVEERGRHGVEVVARDEAPGIADPERAMQDRVVRHSLESAPEGENRCIPVMGLRMGQTDGHMAFDVVPVEVRQHLQLFERVCRATEIAIEIGKLFASRDQRR